MRTIGALKWIAFTLLGLTGAASAGAATLPDGRSITPAGFTIPVENFASSELLSPDGTRLAVLSQGGGAIDVITIGEHAMMSDRLAAPFATAMAWTKDGLYVARGYSGAISRFTYSPDSKGGSSFAARQDIQVGGLLNGIAEDPGTHRIIVARTANQEVDVLDERTGGVRARLAASGQPFAVGFLRNDVFATLYNSDHIDVWPSGAGNVKHVATGPHPTKFLIDGERVFVANADGHDVCDIDTNSWKVIRRFDLGVSFDQPPGQTPSSMAISQDRKQLFVAESGFNDVAVVDLGSGRTMARIPTAWYPMDVAYLAGPTIDDDPRVKPQLFVLSAQGLGQQPDPGSEHDGTYTGLVQHLIVEPHRFAAWTATHRRRCTSSSRST